MKEGKYSLRYLLKAEEDINEIAEYIILKLNSPASALKLIDKIENAILERLNCPLSFQPFESTRYRKHPYYRIYVNNFVVYYVVIEDIMEVRRILYKGRNASELL